MGTVKIYTTIFVVALFYTLTTATESFGSNLIKDLVSSAYDKNKNTIVSPFSAETCLAMIRMGAGGKTSQELDKILNLSKFVLNVLPDNYHNELAKYAKAGHFKFANKIYVKNGQSINEDFKTLLTGKFFSSAENMDFSQTEKAAEAINEWVASTTGNTINNLEENLQSNTDLLLVSSVNFNGPWKTGFNANWTKPDKFYVDEDDNFVMVPMMKVRSYFRYGRQAAMNAGAILLPYRDAGLSMLVVVPFRADGLDKVLTTMKSMDMPTFIETKVFQRKSIEFRMPKFKMDVTVNLKDSLKNLAMINIFEGANLGKILTSSEPISVTDIIQQINLEIGEEGDPASPILSSHHYSRNNPFFRFSADGPFYYAILNKAYKPLIEGVFVGA